jgi:phage baseplate assembly protein W
MALVINVAYNNVSEAKSYIYKDASFKTIGNILPKYIEFGTSNIKTAVINGNTKKYINFNDNQRIPRMIFTSSKRRYEIYPYEIEGNAIYIDRILREEGINDSDIGSELWKLQLSGIVQQQSNSLYDRNAIKNSIRNLFNFSLRERIILPSYGSVLNDLIGVAMTDGQNIATREAVEKMMGWEPRIKLQDVSVKQNPDNYEIDIQIIYAIPALKLTGETLSFLISVTDN